MVPQSRPMVEVDKLYIVLHVQQTPIKDENKTFKTTREKPFKAVKIPIFLNTDT